ncbi:MAG: sulfite exporter TauE/SafE family protein, partial [Terracidiphilus sp.]
MSQISGALAALNWHWLWLVVAAFLAGGLNAVAGGGSFLSFPALLGTGILPVQANATNTVAIWPGQLTSIAAYWPDVRKNRRAALLMGLAGLIGGSVGAVVLLNTPQRTFMRLVPWLLLFAATTFAASGPVARGLERRKRKREGGASPGGSP